MSEEQFKAFLEKVKGDTSLQEQLKAEGADVVAIAKSAGFSITTEDLKSLQPLSEDELEGMAGGKGTMWKATGCATGNCYLSAC
jgi:predicted ribosomally synthesized peptide with nif11-like leader